MTEKLADDCRMAFENYWCEIGMRRAMPFWKDTGTDGEYVDPKMADAWRHWQSAWNTRHEATKAATSDDVREALANAPQWQPIETAPKDGSAVLLSRSHCCRGTSRKYPSMIASWRGRCWKCVNGKHDSDESFTHWMPLPAAPNGGAE